MLSESKSEKRQEYLPWEDYFMSVTLATAKRGTAAAASQKHAAATVVNNRNIIIGTAFEEPSSSSSDNIPVETKAIRDVKYWTPDCTIYCTRFPHPESVGAILDSQISKVIYLEAKDQTCQDENASRNTLEEGNVKLWHFKPQRKKVEICLQVQQ